MSGANAEDHPYIIRRSSRDFCICMSAWAGAQHAHVRLEIRSNSKRGLLVNRSRGRLETRPRSLHCCRQLDLHLILDEDLFVIGGVDGVEGVEGGG